LIAYGRRRNWQRDLLRAAKAYSAIVERDWRRFKQVIPSLAGSL